MAEAPPVATRETPELIRPGYEARAVAPTRRRSFLQQTLVETFKQPGARIGSLWILVLVFFGVTAPFIASSHPVLMKSAGRWSSPMVEHLTPVDLTIAGMAVVVATLLVVKPSAPKALLIFFVSLAALGAASSLKSYPTTINYQQYRDLQRAGQVEWSLRTIIPFSANDRLRDYPDARLSPPSWAPPLRNFASRITRGWFKLAKPDDVAKVKALPSASLLGTETNGADLFSRMIHASRIALSIGFISTSIALAIGVLVGGFMGYYVGKIDLLGMRVIEIFEAVPTLLILIMVMAAYGRNLYLMMVVIGLLSWTGTARFIRAEFLRLRNQDFVHAAVALGLPQPIVIYRHILPNGLTPVLVTSSFSIASAILTEATLSFLGLGLIDEPSWGQMLNQARSGGQGFVWWMAIFPGLAIFLTVYAYSLIGDAMRDALDPKLRKRD